MLPLFVATALLGCVSDSDSESDSEEEVGFTTEALEMSAQAALGWATTSTAPVGSIEGSFQVDAMGAASYSIPIQVPPGHGGVQPKLSLDYNSSAGNGIAGVGFNLTGLPKITRCARTMAQDGVRGGVKGDQDDRFCLDGQRLVASGGGGTEYRTELETWSRITSVGNCNTGVCYFNVVAKDGTVIELGGTPDSRTMLLNGLVRTWSVSKVTSPNFNYMVFSYANFGDGEAYPSSITYTLAGGAPAARTRWVKLEYEPRSDVEHAYLNGTVWATSRRLSSIKTFVKGSGDVLVRQYKLSYVTSPTTFRSLLSAVEECDGAGACLPPTTFEWPTQGGTGFDVVTPPQGQYQHDLKYDLGAKLIPGDFDGDGLTDFIRQERGLWDDDDFATFKVYYSSGDGYFPDKEPSNANIGNYALDMKADQNVQLIPGDFDGDGKTDLIRQTAGNGVVNGQGYFRVYYARERGVFHVAQPLSIGQSFMHADGAFLLPVDYDGDGKMDFIRQEKGDWGWDDWQNFRVYRSKAEPGEFTMTQWSAYYWFQPLMPAQKSQIIPGDFDGDGKTDFIRLGSDGGPNFIVFFSRGDSDGGFNHYATPDANYQDSLGWGDQEIIPGDFNGDGKTDFIRQVPPHDIGFTTITEPFSFQVHFSKGNGEFLVAAPPGPEYQTMLRANIARLIPVDFNGDGKTDLLRQERAGWAEDDVNNFHVYISRGDGTFHIEQPNAMRAVGYTDQHLLRANAGCNIIPGDFNGDGNDDFIRQEKNGWDDDDVFTFNVYFANSPKGGDLVTRIVTGLGLSTDIEYGPLTDTALHVPQSAAEIDALPDHVVPLRKPVYVVKSYLQEGNDPEAEAALVHHRFTYEGAQIDRHGRGFRGFVSVKDEDLVEGVVSVTRFHQDFPLTGKVKEKTVTFPGGETLAHEYDYSTTTPTWLSSSVFVAPTREKITRTQGGQSYTTVTEFEYDDFGNQALVHHRGLEGYPGDDYDTCTRFHNDPLAWRLGYPTNIVEAPSCSRTPSNDCTCTGFLRQELRHYSDGHRVNVAASWLWDNTNGIWLKTTYQYDSLGRVTQRTDPTGAWETMTYDPTDPGFLQTVERCGPDVACRSVSFARDPRFGEWAARTDENNVITSRSFDGLGRVSTTWVLRPGAWVQLTNHGFSIEGGRPVRWTQKHTGWDDLDPWVTEREVLDGLGRVVRRVTGGPGVTNVVRDLAYHHATNLTTWESLPYFEGQSEQVKGYTKVYDAQGRMTQVVDPAGLEVSSSHAIDRTCTGCVLAITATEHPAGSSQAQATSKRFLDIGGRVLKQIDAEGRVTTFEYDRLGRTTAVGDGAAVTTITYDSIGHVLVTSSPDRGQFKSEYDARGLLVKTTDARGQVVNYHYDGLARLTKKEVVGHEDVVFQYDQSGHLHGKGRLTTASVMAPGVPVTGSPRSRYKFGYAHDGQPEFILAYIDGISYRLDTKFDPLGRARTVTRAGHYQITRTYDLLGNLTEVKATDLTDPSRLLPSVTLSDHTAAGQPRTVSYANYATHQDGSTGPASGHTTTAYAYDVSGRLTDLVAQRVSNGGGSVTLLDYDYHWSSAGRLSQIADKRDGQRTQTFTYTPAGSLEGASGVYGARAYSYDGYGRLQIPGWDTTLYANHRLTEISRGPVGDRTVETYGYDAAGNRTSKVTGEATWTYEYDGESRLTRTYKTLPGGTPQLVDRFSYTFSGQRATKTTADGTKTFYVTPDAEVTRLPDGARLDTFYLTGPAGRLASFTKKTPAGGGALLPFRDKLAERALYDERSLAGLLAIAATFLSAWRLHPDAPLHGAAAATLLLAIALPALAGRRRLRRALAATAELYQRRWAARFDTRFVRAHRLYALAVPVVVASLLGGCQPARSRGAPGEDVGEAESALTPGENGAGVPEVGAHYFLHNHIGSSSVVTDSAGAEIARVEYTPSGEIHAMPGDGEDVFRAKFTGKEWDGGSEIYYFNARYYDPATGQFLTPDTRLFGGPETMTASFNPYAYAGYNPVVFTDPSGHQIGFAGVVLIAVGIFLVGAYMGAAAATGTYDPSLWDWKSRRMWIGFFVGGTAAVLSTGACAALGGGVAASVVTSMANSAVMEGLRFMSDEGNDANGFLLGVGTGALGGGIGGSSSGKLGTKLVERSLKDVAKQGGTMAVGRGVGAALDDGNLARALPRGGGAVMDAPGGFHRNASATAAGGGLPGIGSFSRPDHAEPRSGGPGSGDDNYSPMDVTGGNRRVERMGEALLRRNMGLESLVPLVAPVHDNDSRTWTEASSPR